MAVLAICKFAPIGHDIASISSCPMHVLLQLLLLSDVAVAAAAPAADSA